MSSIDTRFGQLLKAKVEDEILTLEEILGGGAAADFADYKHKAGQIMSFKNVLAMIEETEKQLVGVN